MSEQWNPKKLEWYWIEKTAPRPKRKLFNDNEFQLMRPTIRREG